MKEQESDNYITQDESFRDRISTVDRSGKRIWVYPKKPSGRYHRARLIVSWFLLAFLFSAPIIHINGHPLFLLNIFERRFIILGIPFWPQDFHLFVLGMLLFVLFIVLFTVVFGRVWCGWACPQTIFMEMVFRKVEYWIEGDAPAQRRLDKAPWTLEKVLKKGAKHFIFLVLAFIIAHTVLAWIIGIEQVLTVVTSPPSEHLTGFFAMMGTTGLIYGIYARFREQMCTTFCPYGRLQGVLIGDDTMVIAYDFVRGEPRGKLKDSKVRNTGDCIDCKLCVAVCPTGIDIRNGTQLECVNCTACIDACDQIMDKINRPRGLIRYASYNSIVNRTKFSLTPRMKAYTAVLVLLLGVLIALLATRSAVETILLRAPGTLYYQVMDGYISNLYQLQLINKTYEEMPVRIETDIEGAQVRIIGKDQQLVIPKNSSLEKMIFIDIPENKINGMKTTLKLKIYSGDKLIDVVKTSFLGPGN